MDTPVTLLANGSASPIRYIGDGLRAGAIDPIELLEAALVRIDAHEPALGAFITIDRDGARRAAEHAHAELRAGRDHGPLHGIPIGLKDVIDTVGLPTTAGSRILADRVPTRDAVVARRLRAAGAVVVGKLALTEFATGSAAQPAIGPTRNPWDIGRVPGGSSSGSAAAVAAGFVTSAIGTDTSGSVRGPAALCGLVGVRPTRGRISTAGVVPLSRSLDTVGPLARSTDDAGTVLAILGRWPVEVETRLLARPDPAGVQGKVVARLVGDPWSAVDPEVATATDDALATLERAGTRPTELVIPGLAEASAARHVVQYSEAAAFHAAWLDTRPADYDPSVLALLRTGRAFSATEVAAARRTLAAFRRSMRELMTTVDLLLCATTAAPAWTFDEAAGPARLRGIALTAAVTTFGLPVVSVPSGISSGGLPLGVQVIGSPDEEALLLDAAAVIEAAADLPGRLPVTPVGLPWAHRPEVGGPTSV